MKRLPKRKGMLMICYYYPPIKSMGVMRSYALSHEWLSHFSSVSVITTQNNIRLQSDDLPIDNRLKIIAVPTFDYRTITSLYSDNSHYSESSKQSWIGQFLVKFLNSFPFSSWIGEGGFWYMRKAYAMAVKLIKENDIGYVYSSFRPHADHQVAAKLKSKFPHLKWIADFRDIHVDVLKQNVLFPPYQHKVNQTLLKQADVVTTVSHGCAQHIQKYVENTVDVIYNGVHDSGEVKLQLNDSFTVVYTGSLYGTMRDPSIVFTAIEELILEDYFSEGFKIVYAGKDGVSWNRWVEQYRLQAFSENLGLCSYQESRSLQRTAHINLQLTFAHPEVTGAITGKLMEYLQARRPIICVINGSKDPEIETFLKDDNVLTVYNVKEDVQKVKLFIQSMYRAHLTGHVAKFEVEHPSLARVTWPNLANKFVENLEMPMNE